MSMRLVLTAILLCAFALISLPVSLPGQQATRDTDELENSSHYVPPSARQSVEIGNFYLRRKNYRGALSRYQEAAKDEPDYAPAYLGLGKVYEKMGKEQEALAAYHKYLDALPSQKQADEATEVHKAIRRLERELNREHKRASRTKQSPSSAKK